MDYVFIFSKTKFRWIWLSNHPILVKFICFFIYFKPLKSYIIKTNKKFQNLKSHKNSVKMERKYQFFI